MSRTGPDHSHHCPSCDRHIVCQRNYERGCPWPEQRQCDECYDCDECDDDTSGQDDGIEMERLIR
jgi:hypothetical protein